MASTSRRPGSTSSSLAMISGDIKMVYPPGCKPVSADLGTDDLVRRLKECALAFQNMNQDDDNSMYSDLALHLASEYFLESNSKEVRLLIACCIADVFRVFAPEAPYKDPEHLRTIFEFFIEQLSGLEDPKNPTFKRYFYLLENLAWVKTFNICLDLESSQTIITKLFASMFMIVNEFHSNKVRSFMLDMMCPLINEADMVSQKLLDTCFQYLIVPQKNTHKWASSLVKDLLKKTITTLDPYIKSFFNNYLVMGKTSGSTLCNQVYELIYELNVLFPSVMAGVLPQLEMKLKCKDNGERMEVTKLVARMFSEKNSDLAQQYSHLWVALLGRFNDIKLPVRMRCVQYSMHFLLNQPSLRGDIHDALRTRQHDPSEQVRFEVVMAIIEAAKKDFSAVNVDLLNIVRERTLDKSFKVRREALLGLSTLYKQHMHQLDTSQAATKECVGWIKNKVLHIYYQSDLEDRLLVERILHTNLVPYQAPSDERTKKLYELFATIDDHAAKALLEILRCQHQIRSQMRAVTDALQATDEATAKDLQNRIVALARNFPVPVRVQEYISQFCDLLKKNPSVLSHMQVILQGNANISEAEKSVKEVLKSLGLPVMSNTFFVTIKQVLERVAPIIVDTAAIKQMFGYVKDSFGSGDIDVELGVKSSAYRGLELLHTLSVVFPTAFLHEDVFLALYDMLTNNSDDNRAVVYCLQMLSNVAADIECSAPNIAQRLLPVIRHLVENGEPKQAKHAVRCLNVIASNKERLFGTIIDILKKYLSLDSQYFETALVSLGHIALVSPDLFFQQMKSIVSKVVVKELLMQDHEEPRMSEGSWCLREALPNETRIKLAGIKMMVRWLMGLAQWRQQQLLAMATQEATNSSGSVPTQQDIDTLHQTVTSNANSALRLLFTMLKNNGDLMEREYVSECEKSWFRFAAASAILKIASASVYADLISLDQFQRLIAIATDETDEVRELFYAKLHRRLLSMQLPLQFMSLFAYGALESKRQVKTKIAQYLTTNVQRRRDYLRAHPITSAKLLTVLPDYIIVYAVHLLAHDPAYGRPDDINGLNRLKECVWFLLEPIVTENETYSFSYFKKLLEGIKRSKDKQSPDDEVAQYKLYAICDLALGLVMAKTSNYGLKEVAQEARLPAKLYILPDKSTPFNNKYYLPPDIGLAPPKPRVPVPVVRRPPPPPKWAQPEVQRAPLPASLLQGDEQQLQQQHTIVDKQHNNNNGGGGAQQQQQQNEKRTLQEQDDERVMATVNNILQSANEEQRRLSSSGVAAAAGGATFDDTEMDEDEEAVDDVEPSAGDNDDEDHHHHQLKRSATDDDVIDDEGAASLAAKRARLQQVPTRNTRRSNVSSDGEAGRRPTSRHNASGPSKAVATTANASTNGSDDSSSKKSAAEEAPRRSRRKQVLEAMPTV